MTTCVTRIFVEPVLTTVKEQAIKTYFSRFGPICAFELVNIILSPSVLLDSSDPSTNVEEQRFYKITFSSYLSFSCLDELIKQPHSIENQWFEIRRYETSVREGSMTEQESNFSYAPVSPKEEAYYEECKQYYHLTQTPLISVSDEIFNNNNTEPMIYILKFGIEDDYDNFNVEEFLMKICNLLSIDRNNIEITRILKGCIILEVILKHLDANEIKIKIKMLYHSLTDAIRKELGKIKTFFMFMGDLKTSNNMQKYRDEIMLHPEWNRIYGTGHTCWTGALQDGRDRGPHPYYCPVGWKRYAFFITDEFDEKFKGWSICYHGTKYAFGLSILLGGLKPATVADHGAGIYTTPSIIYASHPRYAEVKRVELTDEYSFYKKGQYIQFVLQCRVHPSNITKIGSETLDFTGKTTIDPNMSNDIIEWVVDTKKKNLIDFNDPNATIVCTGLMVRVTDNHPGLLDESAWWYESHLCTKGNNHCALGIDYEKLMQQKDNGEKCNIIYA